MNPIKVETALAKIAELEARLKQAPEPLKKCPLSGHDIMARFGLEPGPIVGMLQSYLLKKIETGVNPEDKDSLWSLSQHWLTGLQIKIMCSKGAENAKS